MYTHHAIRSRRLLDIESMRPAKGINTCSFGAKVYIASIKIDFMHYVGRTFRV